MPRLTVPIRTGVYNGCGVSLRICKGATGVNRIEVTFESVPTMTWKFDSAGVFRGLGADIESVPVPVPGVECMPRVLLACPHIQEDFKGTVVRSAQAGQEAGWICCTDCIQNMLVGVDECGGTFVTHIIAREIEEKITRECTVLDTVLKVRKLD